MGRLTIEMTDDRRRRLEALARSRGFTLGQLFEEFGAQALGEFEAECRFHAREGRGDVEGGLAILSRLDGAHKTER